MKCSGIKRWFSCRRTFGILLVAAALLLPAACGRTYMGAIEDERDQGLAGFHLSHRGQGGFTGMETITEVWSTGKATLRDTYYGAAQPYLECELPQIDPELQAQLLSALEKVSLSEYQGDPNAPTECGCTCIAASVELDLGQDNHHWAYDGLALLPDEFEELERVLGEIQWSLRQSCTAQHP